MKRRVTISLNIDPGITDEMLCDYVCEALEHWAGGGDPESPLFNGVECKSVQMRGVVYRFAGELK